MISKVYGGHSFYHACRYIVTKQGAEVLYTEGVRSHDYKLMAEDFRMQQETRPLKEKACFHASLSFYPGEGVSNEQMVKLAKEYLEQLGVRDTQFAITKHTDRKHPHLHIIANLVDNNGKAIKDSYLGLTGKKVAQKLTKEYKLTPAMKKNLDLTNKDALGKEDGIKYQIYQAVSEALPYSKNLAELEAKLEQQAIKIQYKYKGKTTQLQGISFEMNNYIFKGSSVDRQFSIGNLQRILAQSQKESLQLIDEEKKNQSSVRAGTEHIAEGNSNQDNVLTTLVKPAQNTEPVTAELLEEKREEKKKQRRLNMRF